MSSNGQAASDALENQRAVGAAKTKIVFYSNLNVRIPRRIGTVVEVTFRVLVKNIDSWRNFLMVQRENRKNRLNAPGPAQQVTRH